MICSLNLIFYLFSGICGRVKFDFVESLLLLLWLSFIHSFIATQHAMFLKKMKCDLQSGEFVVLCDIVENYSSTLQDEA
jgi:hypothetical protein